MAPHSSTLAWKMPWTEEPGWLQSMVLSVAFVPGTLHILPHLILTEMVSARTAITG